MTSIESTWATRDLPILAAALRRLDAGEDAAELADIGAETGVRALESAESPYISAELGGGWGDERYGGGYIDAVSERARRELGSWPSADSLLEQLVVALRTAADEEPEPDRKSRLRSAAGREGTSSAHGRRSRQSRRQS